MKFIIPKNYQYHPKILGFIDYVTAIVDLLIGIILFLIIKFFTKKITTRNIYFYSYIYTSIIRLNFYYRRRKYHRVFCSII